ncbi:MAG: hypothetical protein ABJB93_07770 [Gaiellales bacterium]
MTAASATGGVGWSWRRRLPVIVVAAGLITLIELRAAVTIQHARHSVYQLPAAAVIAVVVVGAIAAIAAIGLVLVPRPGNALMVAVVAALGLGGAATFFGIGLLLLPGAAVGAVALIPALRGEGGRNLVLCLLCGVPLGAGLVAVTVVSIQPPLLRCGQGTVTESQRVWWGGGTGTWSGTAWFVPPSASGRITSGGHTFRYTCRGPSLVHFDKT